MRLAIAAAFWLLATPAAMAQIAAPEAGIANYDPTMSAKEAVLANWELAAAGIRAGKLVSRKVVELGEGDASYAALARQAQFAQKTMVQRYNAALWIYTPGSGVPFDVESGALHAAVAAAQAPCVTENCTVERAALLDAFKTATDELDKASQAARVALTEREDQADTVLMSEQLGLVAEYLEGGTWAEGFTLTDFGRDGEEVAARIVGAMSLWRNIEPYVGLANPEIDAAINDNARELLRTLRKVTREAGALTPDGPELMAIKERADALAVEFRRAAAIFSS